MKLEMRFCKKGILKYISHLDLVRLFQRATRRAELPVKLSEGFTPHYKISFGNALKLGLESEGERIVFTLREWVGPEQFTKRLNEKLPKGIRVKAVDWRWEMGDRSRQMGDKTISPISNLQSPI